MCDSIEIGISKNATVCLPYDGSFAIRVSKYASSVAHIQDFTPSVSPATVHRPFAAAFGFLTSDR